MANPNQQNQNPGRQGQSGDDTGRSQGSTGSSGQPKQNQGSNQGFNASQGGSRSTQGSENQGSRSSGSQDQGSRSMGSQEHGDVRDALRELAEGLECLCGEGAQKDVEGARRHADKAQRMIGGRSGGSSRDDSDRDSRSEGRNL